MGCFVNDTTVVTITPQPLATQGTTNPATCGSMDGSFDYNITTTGSYTVEILDNSGNVINSVPDFTGPGASSATGLAAGTYTINMTDNSSGCTNSLGDIVIDNNPSDFTIVNSSSTPAACDNPTGAIAVTLSADVFPISYVLSNNDDGSVITGNAATFNAGTTFIFDIPNVPAGTYDLEVSSNGGCVQTSSNISVTAPADVDITTEPNYDVCGSEVLLMATSTTADARFTWSGPGGFTGSTISGETLSTTTNGVYTVVASAPGFCDVTETTTVNLAIQPIVQINRVGDECDGSIRLLAEVTNVQPGVDYVYSWNTGSTLQFIEVTEDGTYEVTVRELRNLTCTAVVSEDVTLPLPIEGTLTSTPPCEDGQNIELSYVPNPGTGTPTTFSWFYNGTQLPNATTATISVSDPPNDETGTYRVVASSGSCNTELSINIRRFAIPPATLPERVLYCPNAVPTIVTAGQFFVSYEWTLDGQPFPDGGETLEVTAAGIYTVTMTTSQGCQRIASMEVIESCDPVIVAPNALIPTGTAPNNTFSVVPNEFVNNFEIFIYTRWGELIYHSDSLEFKWDGTTNGTPVPGGTYAYIMKFTSVTEPERGVFEQTGVVKVIL